MPKITPKQALVDCIAIWDLLSKNPSFWSIQAVQLLTEEGHDLSYLGVITCPACVAATDDLDIIRCGRCPIWGGTGDTCTRNADGSDGVYLAWANTVDLQIRTKTARTIRNLAKTRLAELEE